MVFPWFSPGISAGMKPSQAHSCPAAQLPSCPAKSPAGPKPRQHCHESAARLQRCRWRPNPRSYRPWHRHQYGRGHRSWHRSNSSTHQKRRTKKRRRLEVRKLEISGNDWSKKLLSNTANIKAMMSWKMMKVLMVSKEVNSFRAPSHKWGCLKLQRLSTPLRSLRADRQQLSPTTLSIGAGHAGHAGWAYAWLLHEYQDVGRIGYNTQAVSNLHTTWTTWMILMLVAAAAMAMECHSWSHYRHLLPGPHWRSQAPNSIHIARAKMFCTCRAHENSPHVKFFADTIKVAV